MKNRERRKGNGNSGTENREQKIVKRKQGIGNRELGTGNGQYITGNRNGE